MNGASFAGQCTRWKMRALVLGLIAGIVCVIGAFFDRAQFSHSYLFAWLFWIGLSLGALVIVMMQALTGGKWGAAIRNLSTAAFMTLPLMALLFLPVLFGAHQIYGWSMGALGEAPGYHHKEQWLNLPFFVGRSFFYFVVLTIIALFVRRWQQPGAASQLGAMSAGGLIAYVLCMNFASTDWVMSLDPVWYSTIFVIIFIAGHFLSALALMTGSIGTGRKLKLRWTATGSRSVIGRRTAAAITASSNNAVPRIKRTRHFSTNGLSARRERVIARESPARSLRPGNLVPHSENQDTQRHSARSSCQSRSRRRVA